VRTDSNVGRRGQQSVTRGDKLALQKSPTTFGAASSTASLREGEHIRQEEIAEELGISRSRCGEPWWLLIGRVGSVWNHTRVRMYRASMPARVRDHYDVLDSSHGVAARHAAERGGEQANRGLRDLTRLLKRTEDSHEFER